MTLSVAAPGDTNPISDATVWPMWSMADIDIFVADVVSHLLMVVARGRGRWFVADIDVICSGWFGPMHGMRAYQLAALHQPEILYT